MKKLYISTFSLIYLGFSGLFLMGYVMPQDNKTYAYYQLTIVGLSDIVVYATLDTGSDVILYRKEGTTISKKKAITLDVAMPSPMYVLNMICDQYNLEVVYMDRLINGMDEEYTYLLINKAVINGK